MANPQKPRMPQEMVAHYADGYEEARLTRGAGQIERDRTQELLRRFLPSAPAVVLDVGGGGDARGRRSEPDLLRVNRRDSGRGHHPSVHGFRLPRRGIRQM